jgi:putative serine protease PepD
VERNGPAGKAGLRTGDLITKLDSRRVDSMEELVVGIRLRRPGDKILMEYERGAGRDRATVTLGSRVG